MAGRPATGRTPVISFRPPTPLREELDELATAEGRDRSDVLIEAVHDWVRKKRREQATSRPADSGAP
ncbi:ribbon-helix-helix domain-containing protein [Streptomyces sp. A3M-1-3]|uniref:ribbon-helix-helix domain-containing protein n=1 Tax=Streptomyces sp. A3M-1-3 TaxID=2962044 RepID=UPI0020B708F4|nr:ribbon-helix-helix domain-containing protein [Streptomyces sp. A3M-1-3]MCP3820045.1 ribbon-helix-helix domain-containing protein [Streptomyces sp. A3M-1-3]